MRYSYFRDRWLVRIFEHVHWLKSALGVYEGRDDAQIAEACTLFKAWASSDLEHDHELVSVWECFVYDAYKWADGAPPLAETFPSKADPAWEVSEMALVAGLVFAVRAEELVRSGTRRGEAVAAMLYADSVEARAYWLDIRGLAGCRHPNEAVAQAYSTIRKWEDDAAIRAARSEFGRANARRRLDRDPRQKAKAEAFNLWTAWQEGRDTHANQAAFARHVCERLGLKDASNVEAWCRQWRKGR